MIVLKNIRKSFGKKEVLKGIDLELARGSAAGLVGPNGSGKSTLLSIMSGLIKADSGKIFYNGVSMKDRSDLSRYAAFVPQDNPLIEELTVLDNLRLWYADSSRDLKTSLKEGFIAEMGLDKVLKERVYLLSGGMKKRLSIACALAYNSPVLLLDEPAASLDLVTKREVQTYVREYLAAGGTVVLSSHEPDELAICDRLFYVVDGMLSEVPAGTSMETIVETLERQKGGKQ